MFDELRFAGQAPVVKCLMAILSRLTGRYPRTARFRLWWATTTLCRQDREADGLGCELLAPGIVRYWR